MTPVYVGSGDAHSGLDLLMVTDETLTVGCRVDLLTCSQLQGVGSITGAMERLLIEQADNATMSNTAKGVMGAVAQQVNASGLGPNGQPIGASRAYAIWQTEKKRQGDADADLSVTAPSPLTSYDAPITSTVAAELAALQAQQTALAAQIATMTSNSTSGSSAGS